jgi:hypothetical protein
MIIPNKNTARGVEKNIIGYALIAMAGTIIFLFGLFINVNNYNRKLMMDDSQEMRQLIRSNNLMIFELKLHFLNQKTEQEKLIAAKNFTDSLDTAMYIRLTAKKK